MTFVGQREAAGVAQHVGMGLELEASHGASTLDHAGKSRCGERGTAFGGEHEWRLRILLPSQPAKRPQFIAADWMSAWCAFLRPPNGQRARIEVNLAPTQIDQ